MQSQVPVLRPALILTAFVGMIVAGTTLLGLLSLVPGIWICDLLSQLRLIWVVILGICVLIFALLRSIPAFAITMALFATASIPVASMYAPRMDGDDREQTASKEFFSVLNFNTEFQHNNNYKSFADLIAEKKPDVIVIVETNQVWIDELADATKDFKYRKIVIKGPGIALFSKYPIISANVSFFGKSHHPRISAVLKLKNQDLNVVVAHPTTPKNSFGYQERNGEIKQLADELSELPAPKMLIADLNCGPWSAEFAKLIKTGLYDSEQGFGPQPSWPARVGRVIEHVPIPPFVPIDHVLVSKSIFAFERSAGPSIGSDHMPVFVRLKLITPR